MTLRPAEMSDASSMAALSIEVWLGTYLKKGINGFFADYALGAFTAEEMGKVIADPAQFLRLSQNKEGIDGFIRLSPGRPAPVEGCSEVEIVTLYVQPRHRGKGIGKRLLQAGLDHARSLGASSVWLATNAENDPAIAFYLAQGFEQVGTTEFRIADQGYLNNVYRYSLG